MMLSVFICLYLFRSVFIYSEDLKSEKFLTEQNQANVVSFYKKWQTTKRKLAYFSKDTRTTYVQENG